MADFLTVHHTTVDPNSGEVKVTRLTPYIRVKSNSAPVPLFLKNGNVYDENGRLQDPVPDWVWEEAARCSGRALRESGFDPDNVQKLNTYLDPDPPEDQPAQEEPEEKPPVKTIRRGRVVTRPGVEA